ncbi:MAG: hypothetical protein KDB50_03260 [Mycobacterium sp.]|nr:hypothetical protein [Mycobacterium sp.]
MGTTGLGVRVGSAAFAVGLVMAGGSPIAAAEESDTGAASAESAGSVPSSRPGSAGRPKPVSPGPTRSAAGEREPKAAAEVPGVGGEADRVAPRLAAGGETRPGDSRTRGTARAAASTPVDPRSNHGSTPLPETVASPADVLAGTTANPVPRDPMSAARETAATPSVQPAATSVTPQLAAITGAVVPQAAAVVEPPTGIVSGLLSLFGLSPSGVGTGAPVAPFAFLTAALELVRREITKLLFNQGPTAAPALISEVVPGSMTGSLNAVDAEGDPLSFTVVEAPAHGTVVVDSDGSFTYTAGADLAATGGVDDFVVEVRDTGFHLNFWSPVTTQVPVTVVVNSAQVASVPLAAASVAGGRTTAITWSWGAHPVLNFNPAIDALDFGWMQADQFGVSDASGSTVISVVGNDHSYTLRDVTLSQLSMGNIVARDSGTVAKWQGLLDTTPPPPTPTVPALSIGGASVAEGDSGTSNLAFTVSLSNVATNPVTVRYATSDGTATAGSDYVESSGTMTFAAGESSKTITVSVIGDTAVEANETFTMTLSNPSGATLATDSAPGTIVNDDTAGGPGTGTGPGVVYDVTTSGPDIVGFNPAKDKLNLGDVSVHNFIVVDTAEGVGFRSPWTGETAVIQGVSLGQLTVDSFTPIINDHLRQDLSGAMAWEHGVTPEPNTVYARSHELGQIDLVAFDPATDVVDFRYYGSREQISMTDSPQGVIIANAGTGQALILEGVTKSQLGVQNFVFHAAQVREDALNTQLGIGPVPDAQVLPQGVPVAGTTNWPTSAGNGTPPSGQSGTTTVIGWHWGSHEVLNFDPEVDKLDFGWFQADNFEISEVTGSTRIAIVNNDQTYTLIGASLAELSPANIIALDDGARQKWSDAINSATPAATLPRLSVADASVVEGNFGTPSMVFTVSLSAASADVVTVGYTTSNGSAYADDYVPAVGLLTFAPGETSKNVAVGVVGDSLVELDEQFTLNLSGATNAAISRGVAVGTILNDDVDQSPAVLPTVSIADLSVTEGNGAHAHFMFMVTLSKASTDAVTVQYATSDGTAVAGADYSATSGTVTFQPGVMSQMVHVDIAGDTDVEPDETFTVTLSNPSGATIARANATGTIVNDDVATDPGAGTGGGPGGGVNSGNAGDALWGEAFFAPYVDMTLYPTPDLIGIARDNGVSLLTLGFLQATQDGRPGWAGLAALATDSEHEQAQAINASIAAFKAAGGDVMISLGGANGVSLAQSYAQRGKSAQELADAYGAVVDTYGLNRIDFDIEGNAVADPASIALNAQALKLFQQQRPDVEIWYTLPVLPSGLTADGLNVVAKALHAGVQLDGVNVMAMDYGEGPAPTSGPNAKTMGAYAIDAAESTYAQLSSLYASHGQTFSWNQLGVTPMIGVNDVQTEVFTVADAQALEDFARDKGLGMVSMWSVGRDKPGPVGTVSPTSSGLSDPAGSFSRTWNDYGTINAMNLPAGGGGGTPGAGGGGDPVEGGVTTVVGWKWGSNTVLNFDPAKDKLDFVWMQPGNFTVTEANGSTVIGIVDNNQTYTLNGVTLNRMRIGNIVALDSGTTAKWQSLISSALAV